MVYKDDLDGYILLMEKAVLLESKRTEKSNIYYENVFNLIESKTYQGRSNEEVIPLIKQLYFHPRFKVPSYFLIIEMLNKLDVDSPFNAWVYREFGVEDVKSLTKKIIIEAEEKLFPNDAYQVMRVSANLLQKRGFYEESFTVKDESISFIRRIFSKDLSTTIAEYEIDKNELESQLNLKIEKQKANKYWNVMVVSMIGLAFFFLNILLLRKKNASLKKQKKEIEKKDLEKKLLLKEIHHRVKNNFQIVSSLLQLQTKGIDDQKAIDLAIESQNRIKAMALIHQKLYQNDELTVHFKNYVESLITNINKAYSTISIHLEINIHPNYTLDIDTAIPLGLILNELITNSFKYAFSKNTDNKICVEFIPGIEVQKIIYKDNGDGIDNSIDLKKIKSTGLRLVKGLTKQLHGELSYENDEGAKFIVSYKETNYRESKD